jgi:type III secretion protein D
LGASLDLEAGRYIWGSGDEADLILSDRSVKSSHLELEIAEDLSVPDGPGWKVWAKPLEGPVYLDGSKIAPEGTQVGPGQALSLGFSALAWQPLELDFGQADFVPRAYTARLGLEGLETENPANKPLSLEDSSPNGVDSEAVDLDPSAQNLENKDLVNFEESLEPSNDSVADAAGSNIAGVNSSELPQQKGAKGAQKRSWLGQLSFLLVFVMLALLVFGWPKVDEEVYRTESLAKLLTENGFEQLSVTERGQALEASGVLDSDSELTRLVELVKGWPDKVFLRISIKRDVLEAAKQALSAYGFHPEIYFGADGRPVVAVYMLDQKVEAQAFADLAQDVPTFDPVRAVVHRSELEPVLAEELAASGLSDLAIACRDGQIEVAVPQGFRDRPALVEAFRRTASRLGVLLVWSLSAQTGPGQVPNDPSDPATALFEATAAPLLNISPEPKADPDDPLAALDIVGVTLEPMRFISTSDGHKLFEGSTLAGGWTITSIEADALLLSSEDEQRRFELAPQATEAIDY